MDRWTYRRLLHAYIVLMGMETLQLRLIADVLSSQETKGKNGSPAPSKRRGLPSWYRHNYNEISVVHVEDPVSEINRHFQGAVSQGEAPKFRKAGNASTGLTGRKRALTPPR